MSEEKTDIEIESRIKSHKTFMHKGEYFHSLVLHDDSTVTNCSPISPNVAEWNAKIRLLCLLENGVIK